ncbi:hypothetical protein LZC95_27030 [Pendulispora brunnea]|uniref:Uncharacterized protein n=1 Tax=Pendulispora brunnea TaxID=2905690 RepID=A0ABZ2JUT3_9BACT
MKNEDLRLQLIRWIAEDDATAQRLAANGSLFDGYHPEMEAIHRENATRLANAVAEYGWPGRALVGEDGAEAAWRIAQHAISEPALMRAWLRMIEDAAEQGDVRRMHVAMLVDRIRVYEGRPQLYGTNYDWSEDGSCMTPMIGIENPECLDERRREMGLPPMEWRRPPPPGASRPRDLAVRAHEMAQWAKRVGWRP